MQDVAKSHKIILAGDRLLCRRRFTFTSHDVTLGATWTQHWSERFSTDFGFELRSLDFEPSTNASTALANTSQTESHLSAGTEEKLSSSFSLSEHLSYGQEVFLHGLSSSLLTIDTAPVASLGAGLKFQALQKGRTEAGVKASAEYYFPASTDTYTIHSGYGYAAGLYLERKYGDSNQSALGLDLFYSKRTQNTSFVDLNESAVGAALRWSLPLFPGGGK